MKRMNFLFLMICLMIKCLLSAQEQSSEAWLEYWLNAIEQSKDHQNFPKAIQNYTSAIQSLNPNQTIMLLNLANERGNLYLKMLDFSNALKDFSFVLNHSQVNREQKIDALWGRSKAYLATGKIREFQNDCNQLEQLEASVSMVEDNKDYSIYKLALYMLRDPKAQERFINLLKMRKEIQSEKDVTFVSSGLVILRKTK